MLWGKNSTGSDWKRYAAVCGIAVLLLSNVVGCSSKAGSPTSTGNNAGITAAQTTLGQPIEGEMAKYYVDTTWLKKNLDKVVILDARGESEYEDGHIPGALNVTWQSLSNMQPKQGQPGWGVVLTAEKLAKKLGSLGIDGSKPIVVYNDPLGLGEEGRVLWTLRMAGLENSRMLNGGWMAWEAAGGAKSEEAAQPLPTEFKLSAGDPALLSTTDYVKNNLGKIKIVDARSDEEYKGETNHGEVTPDGSKALGRIPGAIAFNYRQAYNEDGSIKSIAELQKLFAKAGLKPDDDITVYCTVGIRSAFITELLRMSGYQKAKNYNASFSEWAGAGLSIEK